MSCAAPQLTRDGIVHMAFHPRSDTLILAAADKGGHVGLWHIDRDSCGDAARGLPDATIAVSPGSGRRRGGAAAGVGILHGWGFNAGCLAKPGLCLRV